MTRGKQYIYNGERIEYVGIKRLAVGTGLIDHYLFSRAKGGQVMFTINEWERLKLQEINNETGIN